MIIDYFRDRKDKNEPLDPLVRDRIGPDDVNYLDLGEKVEVESSSCLNCHDKPENAPPGMLASEKGYKGGGFNWYEGQIIGAKIVTVPRRRWNDCGIPCSTSSCAIWDWRRWRRLSA